MATYLLNLVFSKPAGATAADGLFQDYPGLQPMVRSKAWYDMGTSWPAAMPQQGMQVMEASTLVDRTLIGPDNPADGSAGLSGSLDDHIFVQFMPAYADWVGMMLQMDYAVVFGRPAVDHEGATLASPFVFMQSSRGPGMNSPRAVFSSFASQPGPDGSFIFYLGQLAQNVKGQKGVGGPRDPNRKPKYMFQVGANVYFSENNVSGQYAFGHDPKMGVTG